MYVCFVFFVTMSKRKLPVSYSSLRRSVKAQVDADLQFIANEAGNSSNCDLNFYAGIAAPHQAVNVSEINMLCYRADKDDSNHDLAGDSPVVASHPPSDTCILHSLNVERDIVDCHFVDLSSDDEDAPEENDSISMPLRDWAVRPVAGFRRSGGSIYSPPLTLLLTPSLPSHPTSFPPPPITSLPSPHLTPLPPPPPFPLERGSGGITPGHFFEFTLLYASFSKFWSRIC